MADNPIKYSDFIAPDDSIKELLKQLEDVRKSYESTMQATKKEASVLRDILRDVKLVGNTNQTILKNASVEVSRLAKAEADLHVAMSDNNKQLIAFREATKDVNRVQRQLVKTEGELINVETMRERTYNQLSAQYEINKRRLHGMTEEYRRATEEGKNLENETRALRDKMKELNAAIGEHSMSVGDYTNSVAKAMAGVRQTIRIWSWASGALISGLQQIDSVMKTLSSTYKNWRDNMDMQKAYMKDTANETGALIAKYKELKFEWSSIGNSMESKRKFINQHASDFAQLGMHITSVNDANRIFMDDTDSFIKTLQARGRAMAAQKLAMQEYSKAQEALLRAEGLQDKLDRMRQRESKNRAGGVTPGVPTFSFGEAGVSFTATEGAISSARKEAAAANARGDKLMSDAAKSTPSVKTTLPKTSASRPQSTSSYKAQKEVKQKASVDASVQEMGDMTRFDLEQRLASQEFDLLRHTEREKTIFRLEQEKKRWEEVMRINQQYGGKNADLEIELAKVNIQRIEKALGDERQPKNIYDILGMSLSRKQEEEIGKATNFAVTQLTKMCDAAERSAQKKIDYWENELKYARTRYEVEASFEQKGYANSAKKWAENIELIKQSEAKAINEQKKAQRLRDVLSSLEVANNLIVASSKTLAVMGMPLAVPMIAAMWGTFLAARVQSWKVAGQNPAGAPTVYGEGGVELLEGGSHSSGHDVFLGRTKDGRERRAEGGEYLAVVNKRSSAFYNDMIPAIIDSLNNRTFEEKFLGQYSGTPIITQIAGKEVKNIEHDLSEIKNQQRRYTDQRGNLVIVYKNLTKTIIA